MLDPTEVAVDQKWVRDYNRSVGPEAQISAYDIRNAVTEGVKRAGDVFDKAFADGGYPVVTAPGPDVLLGRAVDARLAGDNGILNRNSVTNWSDFRELAKTWANISVAGLHELQTISATPASAPPG